jgi:hypothetical protein
MLDFVHRPEFWILENTTFRKLDLFVDTRLKKHQRHVRLEHPDKTAGAEHRVDSGHRILFHDTSILANKTRPREVTETELHPNNTNRRVGFVSASHWSLTSAPSWNLHDITSVPATRSYHLKHLPRVYCVCQSQSQSHITTDSRSVSMSWCWAHSGTCDQIFFPPKLLSCLCGAPSLMRGRVCLLSVSAYSSQSGSYVSASWEQSFKSFPTTPPPPNISFIALAVGFSLPPPNNPPHPHSPHPLKQFPFSASEL